MPQELTLAALDMAIKRRRPLPGLMHHSDRGSQYAAGAYQKRLAGRHRLLDEPQGKLLG